VANVDDTSAKTEHYEKNNGMQNIAKLITRSHDVPSTMPAPAEVVLPCTAAKHRYHAPLADFKRTPSVCNWFQQTARHPTDDKSSL